MRQSRIIKVLFLAILSLIMSENQVCRSLQISVNQLLDEQTEQGQIVADQESK